MIEFKYWLSVIYPLLRIVGIWIGAWLLWNFLRKVPQALKMHLASWDDSSRDFRRINTLTGVFRYASTIVITAVALMLTLSELGIAIAPIIAAAGVVGIAIGFGAQSLVKDFFTGLFLLIENQVIEGDVIEIAGKSGYVERVTLRHIRIRDYDGSVHFIPNGMITLVTNKSRDFAFAVIDFSIPRHEDLDRVFASMHQISDDMRKDPVLSAAILDDIDIAGVEKVEDTLVLVRCRLKVTPSRQWRIRREFLQRMKVALDVTQTAT